MWRSTSHYILMAVLRFKETRGSEVCLHFARTDEARIGSAPFWIHNIELRSTDLPMDARVSGLASFLPYGHNKKENSKLRCGRVSRVTTEYPGRDHAL